MPAGGNSAPGQGFKKGHPPHYTGGSVPGHAPTYTGPPTMHRGHPNWKLEPYRFGNPAGDANRKKGGNRPKDKERCCLEEIQNGQDRDEILERRYPPRMIRRLQALLDVAEDKEHRDFMHAQRQVREILTRNRGDSSADRAAEGPKDTIEVYHGRVEAQMPGALMKEEGSSARSAEEPSGKGRLGW